MRLFTKIVVGFSLAIGLSFSLLALSELTAPSTSKNNREGALVVLLVMGLPLTSLGSWLIWSARQKRLKQDSDRLRAAFYHVLQENNGHVNVLQFAMAAEIDGERAKGYLNDRAKEFNADFKVEEAGEVSYYFALKHLQ